MALFRHCIRFAAAALCVVVLVLGLVKLTDLDGFVQIVDAHGLLSGSLASVGAIGAVGLEVSVALLALLLLMVHRSGTALVLLGAVFTVFATYSFGLVLRPPAEAVSCGCGFSQAPVERWEPIAARNAALAAACFALVAAFGKSKIRKAEQAAISPAAP